MFCPHCGDEIPDDSIFCPNCGRRIAEEESGAENPQGNGYNQTGDYGNLQNSGYDRSGNYGNLQNSGYDRSGNYGNPQDYGYDRNETYDGQDTYGFIPDDPVNDYDEEGDGDEKKSSMFPILIVGCIVVVAVIGTIAYFTLRGKLSFSSSRSSAVSAPSVSADATPTPVADSDTISIGVTSKPTPTSTPAPTVKATPTPIPTATLAPTATPTPVTAIRQAPVTNGYDTDGEADASVDALINAESSGYLDYSDLNGLSEFEVKLVRNGFYARHGYIFSKDPNVKAYFENKSWYRGTTDNMDAVAAAFNSYEKANLQTVIQYEKDHRYNGYTNDN